MSTTREPGEPGPAPHGRRRVVVVAGVVLLAVVAVVAAVVAGTALRRDGNDGATAGLTVGWGGSEGHPSCVYRPEDHAVDAAITIDGDAGGTDEVTVTVTAYADENTSRSVGSVTRSVPVEGTVHLPLVLTIPVSRAPFVDVDGETACSLSVTY